MACRADNLLRRGRARERSGDVEGALALYESGLQPASFRAGLLNEQARILEASACLQQAELLCEQSLSILPRQPLVIARWLRLRQALCLWPVIPESFASVGAEQLLRDAGPAAMLALTDDIELQHAIARRWIARGTGTESNRLAPLQGYAHDRIRVGYLSAQLEGPAAHPLLAGLCARHDPALVSVHLYALDSVHAAAPACAHARILRDLSPAEAAGVIRRDEIDILVDLDGAAAHGTLRILRHRPAPVQACLPALPAPVPLRELDVMLHDERAVPPELRWLHTPTPFGLAAPIPVAGAACSRAAPAQAAPARAQPRSAPGRFVFFSASDPARIGERCFGAMLAILEGVPDAVLWLDRVAGASAERLRAVAARAGIDPARLICPQRVTPGPNFEVADLVLDSFPWSDDVQAHGALQARRPVLVRNGRAASARGALRALAPIDPSHILVDDDDAYVRRAIALATDPARLEAYAAPFVALGGAADDPVPAFVGALEDAFHRLVRRPATPSRDAS